jgi:putative aldouronate transport system substrate-binding protein
LRDLYAAGLIAEQSFTNDQATLKKIAENPDIAIAGAIPAHSQSTITIIEGASKRWLDYKPIAPLIGPTGKRLAFWNPYDTVRGGTFVMTAANKYPEATVRWADYQYTFENALRSNYGTEGKSWEKAQPGILGRDGVTQAYWRLLVPFGRVQNESWAQMGLSNKSDKYYWAGQAFTGVTNTERMYYEYTMEKYRPYIPAQDTLVPPLFFPSADSRTLAEVDKTINDYVSSMIARFITGDVSLEKGWDSYVKTLDNMGLQKYVGIYQKAYDEKMKKK